MQVLRVFYSPSAWKLTWKFAEHLFVNIEDFTVGSISDCMNADLEIIFNPEFGGLGDRFNGSGIQA